MVNKIRILDEKTINKIAAGEVIERPSSIVKELIENSIDAQATSIIIEINEGGKKYIRVTDNGNGINSNDMEIAFLRHSTSKISKAEDLESLRTLGFRGEALASIAAVSHLQIISKTKEDISGHQIEVHGGDIISKKEVGCPQGTTVIVKNIFYNTPVRRKFLKSDPVESSYISDIIYKLALGNPNISFKFIKDNKLIVKTPGNGDIISVIYCLFGKEFANSLFKIDYYGEDIKIQGYISKPSYTRGNRNYQYFFINNRYIKSELITSAIEAEYKTFIPINRYPVVMLYIQMNPDMFDANIHPTKIEIRFKNEMDLKTHITNAIKKVLEINNLIPEASIAKSNKKEDNIRQNNILDFLDSSREQNTSSFNKESNLQITSNINGLNQEGKIQASQNFKDYELIKEDAISQSKNITTVSSYTNYESSTKKIERIPEMKVLGVLFETYILAEDLCKEIFYIIDQHAAHERILYEEYKKQFINENVASQQLLVPEVVNLTHSEIQLINENINLFEQLGFKIEEFGLNSIVIRSVPLIFGKPDSKKLFMDILDKLQQEIKSNYDLKLEKIIKLACSSAIKAGDIIKDIEINKLITDLRMAENPYTCPHGRPIIIKITKYELEKKFKRIQ